MFKDMIHCVETCTVTLVNVIANTGHHYYHYYPNSASNSLCELYLLRGRLILSAGFSTITVF